MSMRGRVLGAGMAVGPLPVGVGICATAGHAPARTDNPAAQAIAIRPRRLIVQS